MSIRRINSTGRKRLLREDVNISIFEDPEGGLQFEAALNIVDYELPPEARVSLEAYRQSTFMRFDYGTVQHPHAPPGGPLKLSEFATKDGLLFRAKITASGVDEGLLLAEGDQIPIHVAEEQEELRIPLLPPVAEDLGQEVWCVDIGASGPILQVSKHLPDWKAVVSSPEFRCLVFPAAMRQILTYLIFIEKEPDADDSESWRGRWFTFARSLGLGNPPESESDELEKIDWIDEAVRRFSQHSHMVNNYKNKLASETS